MIRTKIVFGVLAFLLLFTGCSKKPGNPKNEILIICDSSCNLAAAELAEAFKEKTGIDSAITIATGPDILALVKVGKKGDILITDGSLLEQISSAGVLAADAGVGFTSADKKPQDPQQVHKNVHVIGLNYSENGMAVMQFVEFAREQGPEIFAKYAD